MRKLTRILYNDEGAEFIISNAAANVRSPLQNKIVTTAQQKKRLVQKKIKNYIKKWHTYKYCIYSNKFSCIQTKNELV